MHACMYVGWMYLCMYVCMYVCIQEVYVDKVITKEVPVPVERVITKEVPVYIDRVVDRVIHKEIYVDRVCECV